MKGKQLDTLAKEEMIRILDQEINSYNATIRKNASTITNLAATNGALKRMRAPLLALKNKVKDTLPAKKK